MRFVRIHDNGIVKITLEILPDYGVSLLIENLGSVSLITWRAGGNRSSIGCVIDALSTPRINQDGNVVPTSYRLDGCLLSVTNDTSYVAFQVHNTNNHCGVEMQKTVDFDPAMWLIKMLTEYIEQRW